MPSKSLKLFPLQKPYTQRPYIWCFLFNLVSSFPSKYLYKTLKKELFTNIKHGLVIIGKDIGETRC